MDESLYDAPIAKTVVESRHHGCPIAITAMVPAGSAKGATTARQDAPGDSDKVRKPCAGA